MIALQTNTIFIYQIDCIDKFCEILKNYVLNIINQKMPPSTTEETESNKIQNI